MVGSLGEVVCQQLDGADHGDAAVLQLLEPELVLLLLVVALPVVAGEAKVADGGALGLLPAEDLPVTDRGGDLEPAEGVDGGEGADAVGDGVEGGAVEVDGAGKASDVSGDQTHHREHRDAAVLELGGSSLVEGLETMSVR